MEYTFEILLPNGEWQRSPKQWHDHAIMLCEVDDHVMAALEKGEGVTLRCLCIRNTHE